MNTHLSEDELILHYYGEIETPDRARVESHLASCAECRFASQQLREVMTLVDSAAPVEAPPGFERVAWARLQPELDRNQGSWKAFFGFPQWALAGGVAALVFAAFVAGRVSSTNPSPGGTPTMIASPIEPGRVLQAEMGDHLDRTQMMLIELANADTDHADVLAGEQGRAVDLVAANRLLRQSAEQNKDIVIADMLEDLERVLLEIANAPADASSNELTDLQSRISDEDLLFRLRVIAAEMRQRTLNDREAGDRVPAKKMPVS